VGGGFTLRYNPASNYDSNVVGAGVIPTDGTHSLTWTTFNGGNTADTFVTNLPRSPQNFNCIDLDADGYGNPGNVGCPGGAQADCNDSNANIGPGNPETTTGQCSDAVDNDCDTLTDCADADCGTALACVPTVSEWGVLVMGLLTLTAGSVLLRQRG
jgi:hypothetical protein